MRLTKQSSENLKVAERVGFDETNAGVLVFVERGGNRAYLHTAAGPACFDTIEAALAAVTRHRRRTDKNTTNGRRKEMEQVKIRLTRDHSASSHGMPVAIIDGQAYGPDDMYDGLPVSAYVIVNIDPSREDHDEMMRFLSQSPVAYRLAIESVERWQDAPPMECEY
jgi:hypothetical protein